MAGKLTSTKRWELRYTCWLAITMFNMSFSFPGNKRTLVYNKYLPVKLTWRAWKSQLFDKRYIFVLGCFFPDCHVSLRECKSENSLNLLPTPNASPCKAQRMPHKPPPPGSANATSSVSASSTLVQGNHRRCSDEAGPWWFWLVLPPSP